MNFIAIPSKDEVFKKLIDGLISSGNSLSLCLGHNSYRNWAKVNHFNFLDFGAIHTEFLSIDNKSYVVRSDFPDFAMWRDNVYKMMDRQDDLSLYDRSTRETYFYYYYNYFITLLHNKRIGFIIFSETPHFPVSFILYMAAITLSVKTYFFKPNAFLPFVTLHKDLYSDPVSFNGINNHFMSSENAYSHLKSNFINVDSQPLYMNNQKKGLLLKEIRTLIKSFFYDMFGRWRSSYSIKSRYFYLSNHSFLYYTRVYFSSRIKFFLNKSFYKKISKKAPTDIDYVYIPLHYEPERTSTPEGCDYSNAYDFIIKVREKTPSHIHVYIKEHPSMFSNKLYGYRSRNPMFYKFLSSLSNVTLIDMGVNSKELIKNSKCVFTQTGTAALEALFFGKPAFLGGRAWFDSLPGIFHINDYDYISIDSYTYNEGDVYICFKKWFYSCAIPICMNSYMKKNLSSLYSTTNTDDDYVIKKLIHFFKDDLNLKSNTENSTPRLKNPH